VPNTDRFLAYLAAYAQKDLVAIRAMFSEDVHLRDWNLSVHGRDAALDETAKNFAAAETIEIEALAVYEKEGAVAGELKIVVDKRIELSVVDVISFTTEGRIAAVRAYLGRNDE
jgi:ketosteroid isomerase-like protein